MHLYPNIQPELYDFHCPVADFDMGILESGLKTILIVVLFIGSNFLVSFEKKFKRFPNSPLRTIRTSVGDILPSSSSTFIVTNEIKRLF